MKYCSIVSQVYDSSRCECAEKHTSWELNSQQVPLSISSQHQPLLLVRKMMGRGAGAERRHAEHTAPLPTLISVQEVHVGLVWPGET